MKTFQEKQDEEALFSCIRHTLAAINDAIPQLKGIKKTKLVLWARNLNDHLPETLEMYKKQQDE